MAFLFINGHVHFPFMQITCQHILIIPGTGGVAIRRIGQWKGVIYLKLPLGVDGVIKLSGHLVAFSTGIAIAQGKRPACAMDLTVEVLGIPVARMEIIFIVIVKGQPVRGTKIKGGITGLNPLRLVAPVGLAGCCSLDQNW